ncbi:MAG: hypothetical protein WC023_07060 [Rhodocyclaceae bacterium]
MPTIASVLASIPATVWSGIIGAILALSGVLLSNRGNTSRLRIQLKHDAAEKVKERTAILRREVYLRAIEELVRANSHLAGLPNLDPTKVNIGDGLQGFFSAAARLQLVAEPKTALLVNRLVGEYGELLLELLAQLQPAHAARTHIQLADHHYNLAQAEVTRVLGEMAKLNESGKPDPAIFRALQSSFNFRQEQTAKFAAERDTAWTQFNMANISFQRALLANLRDLAPKQVPVMIELRRDLGLVGELDELEGQMSRQMERMEERFNALIAKLGDG